VTVYPGQAVNLDDLILVRKDLPLIVTSPEVVRASLSPDNSKFLYSTGKDEQVFSLENEVSSVVSNKPADGGITWATDASRVIAGNMLYYLDGSGRTAMDLSPALGKNSGAIKFDETDAGNIFFHKSPSIYRLAPGYQSAEVVVNAGGPADDFSVRGDRLSYISRVSNKVYLNIWSLSADKLERSIELPFSVKYQFVYSENNFIVLADRGRNSLSVISPDAYSPITAAIPSAGPVYRIDGSGFLYANDFEIWKEDVAARTQSLFTRISQPIKDIIWHPSGKFIIFSTENTINLLDISGPDKKIIELVKFEKISSPALDKKGENLYFYGSIGGMKGLYKLRIQ
jgi:hypothetical protein